MENLYKKKIVKNYKLLLQLGFNIGSEGNISVRRGKHIFITPSGINSKDLKTNDISIIDLKGVLKNQIKPSSETAMHLMIYQKRKEINAIIHCHSNWASILSCLRQKITSFHYMVAEFGGSDIRCSKYATFGSKKLAKNVFDASISRKGCIIANHGQICFGKDVDEALHLSIALEKLSKQFYFCFISNKIKNLTKLQMNEALKLFETYKN
ncbi:MAG: class II aldolase [Rickettsiales bacterium]|nr:class II aldolase [Rickettsiales bacterium]|tara:strand:+ start:159 stop:788 length:630 start_codon:yes stop_codon:yes gene_type:complete